MLLRAAEQRGRTGGGVLLHPVRFRLRGRRRDRREVLGNRTKAGCERYFAAIARGSDRRLGGPAAGQAIVGKRGAIAFAAASRFRRSSVVKSGPAEVRVNPLREIWRTPTARLPGSVMGTLMSF